MAFLIPFSQKFLEFIDVGQGFSEFLRHFIFRAEGGYSHGLLVVFDEVLNDGFVGAFAEKQTDRGILIRFAGIIVQDGQKLFN